MKASLTACAIALAAFSQLSAQPARPFDLEGPRSVNLKVGETAPLSLLLMAPAAATIRLSQETHGQPGGLSISPALPPADRYPAGPTPLIQQLQAFRAGTYVVKTTATSADDRSRTEQSVRVVVTQEGNTFNALIASPAAIKAGDAASVTFIIRSNGSTFPSAVHVEGVGNQFSLSLTDDGAGQDAEAGDGVFTGAGRISMRGVAPGNCLRFRAVAGSLHSEETTVCSTNLPTTLARTPDSSAVDTPRGRCAIDELALEFKPNVSESLKIAAAASAGGSIIGSIPLLNTYQVKLSPAPRSFDEVEAKLRTLRQLSTIQDADAHCQSDTQADGFTPNDPLAPAQWYIDATEAGRAWVVARGKGVTVGVVDTGVMYNHPELDGRVVKGYDYYDNDSDPSDLNSHGTHVAGIIGAKGNNNSMVAGMAWDAKLFATRTLQSSETQNWNGNVGAGIEQAILYGTKVINASVGSSSKLWLCSAVQKTVDAGIVFVAAAGNNGNSVESYPAACGGAIAVGNLAPDLSRNPSSNFGSWVDMSAPGTTILSTVPTSGCPKCDPDGTAYKSGTSMASPMVAGAAALMLSRDPGLSRGELIERLKASALPRPDLNMGAGSLNTFEATFNGSFESGLDWWSGSGFRGYPTALSSQIQPQHRSRLGLLGVNRLNPNAGPQADIHQAFTFPKERTLITLKAAIGLAADRVAPGAPGARLYVILIRDGVASIAATLTADQANQGSGLSGGQEWTGWKEVTVVIAQCKTAEIRFLLTDGGVAKTSYATIDHVRFE